MIAYVLGSFSVRSFIIISVFVFPFCVICVICGLAWYQCRCWSRSQSKLFGIWQRRSRLIFSQRFIHRARFCQPRGNHLIVARQNTAQPVWSIFGQPLLAVTLFQNRKFLSHLAQVVVNCAAVVTELPCLRAIPEIQIRIPVLVAELLHYFHAPSEMIKALRRKFHCDDRGTIAPRTRFVPHQ